VLDQLSDTDLVLGSVRHLTHEDLDAYATGRLASARVSSCQAHLDSCEACRAELEDLRAFKGELASFSRPESSPREFGRTRRRRGMALPLGASIAAVFVLAASAVVWLRHEKLRTNNTSPVTSAVTSVVQPAVAPTPVAAASPTQQVAARPTASEVNRGPASSSAATSEANRSFALLGPNGAAISETRPEFSWQPLTGAIRYSVAIVDARLHPVQRSPALRKTVWRPRRPLRRGRTYFWQVTATLRGGSKVVASAPGTLIETAQGVDVPGAEPRAHEELRTSSSAPSLK